MTFTKVSPYSYGVHNKETKNKDYLAQCILNSTEFQDTLNTELSATLNAQISENVTNFMYFGSRKNAQKLISEEIKLGILA